MEKTAVRNRIVELFEQHRAAPGTACDEGHFLDFLLANPRKRGAVHNSFRGLRRLNAFIEDIQYEFSICFSLQDFEANYSLPQFVDRVIELRASPRGSLRSLKNQVRAGAGWPVVVVVDFVLLITAVAVRNNMPVLAALASLATLLTAGFGIFAWRANAYLEKLRARIEANSARRL